MLDDARRLTIPKALLDRSNLKGVEKVLVAVKGKEILIIPESGEVEQGVKVLGIRALDQKGRIVLPRFIAEMSSDWTPENDKIKVTKKGKIKTTKIGYFFDCKKIV